MIEVKNVVKTFDGFRALDDLTMTVPHGAVYGLVGPNGAGKSTIIRHLAGIYRQDSGDVLVDGQPVYENTAVKQRMAVIGDDWYYFPQSGIREMAKFLAGYLPRFQLGAVREAEGGVSAGRENDAAADEQGYAEAGGLLADGVLYAGVPHSGRAGGWP